MEIVDHINSIQEPFVMTIGNFDGFHRGHQSLLRHLIKQSKRYGAKSCIMMFVPHPSEILNPEKKGFLINSYSERNMLIEKAGIDFLIILKFTRDLSTKSPRDFVKEYLKSNFLKAIHLGYDFSFGKGKEGIANLFKIIFLINLLMSL